MDSDADFFVREEVAPIKGIEAFLNGCEELRVLLNKALYGLLHNLLGISSGVLRQPQQLAFGFRAE